MLLSLSIFTAAGPIHKITENIEDADAISKEEELFQIPEDFLA